MKFYLIDDDKNIRNILKIIITERKLGTVCGSTGSAGDAIEDLPVLLPDIVIVDLLMPEMDGITLVAQMRPLLLDTAFIMLSQVSSKDMVASAYEAGIEYFIQKPINSIEVETVIQKTRENLSMRRTMAKMQNIFLTDMKQKQAPADSDPSHASSVLHNILQRLGIVGVLGSKDIIAVVEYMNTHHESLDNLSLNDLCRHFSDSPKSMEQRIRRAATAGLVNLAHLGIEDYGNEIFTEYSSTLYNFEQVRREMDFIRGKSDKHGTVKIKNFLTTLSAYIKN
ncbi:response regulator [Sporofaciens musculi]|uniref:response regulator n=1 Tax=Sporofaciens musculi TaxID=2681861 RepID=UPI002590A651|nr:response regulator [Sporofaciens musculi]